MDLDLFNCPDKPTLLQPIDLWLRPVEVTVFLELPPVDVDGGNTPNQKT